MSYLLGSIPSGVIAARAFRRPDVRTTGSGHTGAINTFRAAGLAPAVLTFLADGAKGIIAVGVARLWAGDGWAVALAATLAVIGHCYPVFARFRGGMGLTTGGGVFLILQPVALVVLILAWFPIRWLYGEYTRRAKSRLQQGLAARNTQDRRNDGSTWASLAVAVLLPILLVITRAEPAVQASGIGVGVTLFWRHLQVLVWRTRTAR